MKKLVCFLVALFMFPAVVQAHTEPTTADRGGHAAALPPPPVIHHLAAWTCIHPKEAAWNDRGDPYWGGLQMDRGFMAAYGSDMIRKYGGYADQWSPRDQMIVAERAVRTRGFTPWPQTARECGYL